MQNTGTLKVTTPTDREIVMTRVFDAPRALVFDALTKPELLRQWFFGPPGWSMVVCETAPKVGDTYRFVWRGPGGTEMGMRGVCQEIVPPERIVATEKFDEAWYPGEALVTTALVEQGWQNHAHAHCALRVARGPRCRPQDAHGAGCGRGLRQAG